ncbi:hypothetical protein NA57DRAFT_58374 [Rhizodiscina lignyota]|uniref:Uncharacterized protein n=1 Tax=Rhizodiscina lignyota TaxID=1504668 RepID=A0A9P4M850_9PEZI|nr:hypothetical protein NA57DRAFT_58374 [Rhizodiscina lignyota]
MPSTPASEISVSLGRRDAASPGGRADAICQLITAVFLDACSSAQHRMPARSLPSQSSSSRETTSAPFGACASPHQGFDSWDPMHRGAQPARPGAAWCAYQIQCAWPARKFYIALHPASIRLGLPVLPFSAPAAIVSLLFFHHSSASAHEPPSSPSLSLSPHPPERRQAQRDSIAREQ